MRNTLRISRFIFLVTIVVGLLFPLRSVSAQKTYQQADNQCANMDVVFLVNQSEEMANSDPSSNREYAVEGMIDLLADLSINQCPDSSHRIAVISFAGSTRLDIPLSTIDPSTSSDAKQIREELRPRIGSGQMPGQANLNLAYEQAAQILNSMPIIENNKEARKRVVILLSTPTTANLHIIQNIRKLFSFDGELALREKCLQRVRNIEEEGMKYINYSESIDACNRIFNVEPDAYLTSTYLYFLVFFSDQITLSDNFLTVFENLMNDYQGELIQASENQIPTSLRKILSLQASSKPITDCDDLLVVNPYMPKLILSFYKKSSDEKVIISYTDNAGVQHQIQNGVGDDGFRLDPDNGYYQFGANETYTFLDPYPGLWKFDNISNSNGCDFYYTYQTYDIREVGQFSQIPVYNSPPFYNPKNPFHIAFEMHGDNANGEIVDQADANIFQIETIATVIAPDGSVYTYQMPWNPESHAFVAPEPLQVPITGIYQVNIKGTTRISPIYSVAPGLDVKDIFTQEFTLFEIDYKFTGLPVLQYKVEILSPAPDETFSLHETIISGWPLKPRDVTIKIRYTDADGRMVHDIYGMPLSITADVNNSQIILTIPLEPDPANPGEWIGKISGSILAEGDNFLTISVVSDDISYDFVEPNVPIQFYMRDALFETPQTYYGFLAAFMIIILLIVLQLSLVQPKTRRANLLAAMVSTYNGITDLVFAPVQLSWAYKKLNKERRDVILALEGLNTISDNAKEMVEEDNPFVQRSQLLEIREQVNSLRQKMRRLGNKYARLWEPALSQWQNILNGEWEKLEANIARGLIESPYEVGNPLQVERKELFKGRSELRDSILTSLRDRSRFTMILSGQRRMGKTSFLLQLPILLPLDTIPIFIDLQRPTATAGDGAFAYEIARAISAKLRTRQIECIPPARGKFLERSFEVFDAWMDDEVIPSIGDNTILLTFDEFEKVGQALSLGRMSERSMDEIRHTIQHRPKVAILFAGVQTLDELGPKWSSYFINVRSFSLGYLSEDEARSLITKPEPSRQFPLTYSDDAIAHIIQLTHCHPYLVQLVCSCVIELVNKTKPLRFDIDLDLVQEAETLSLERGEPYFRNIWDEMATETGQSLLRKIATVDILPNTDLDSASRKIIDRLARYQVVSRRNDGYTVEIPLVRRWINERSPES